MNLASEAMNVEYVIAVRISNIPAIFSFLKEKNLIVDKQVPFFLFIYPQVHIYLIKLGISNVLVHP